MRYTKKLYFLFILFPVFFLLGSHRTKLVNLLTKTTIPRKETVLNTVYGKYKVEDPVVHDLLDHPMFDRLKHVRQYGISYHVIKPETYHRHEHSVGVYVLLKKYGASLHEQVAGLLHDASHTVFSHVGEWIFDHEDGLTSYQDDNHDAFLVDSGLELVLLNHGFTVADINHKNNNFKRLEQDLPDLCLDRIEYNLQGGLRENLITLADLEFILDNLLFEDDKWFFIDIDAAKKFSVISLYHTEKVWGNPVGLVAYKLAGQALKIALKNNYITLQEIKFGKDDEVWNKLIKIEDSQIRELVDKLKKHKTLYKPTSKDKADFYIKAKFRGVDPLVKTEKGLERLTDIDSEYAKQYKELKEVYSEPMGIKEVGMD